MNNELKAIIEDIDQISVCMNDRADALDRFCADYANKCTAALVALKRRKQEGPDDGRVEQYNADIKELEKEVSDNAEMYSQFEVRVRPLRKYAEMLMDVSYKYRNLP